MEGKKLTDEEIVAKNAITDEEIAKAILQSIEYGKTITYFDEWGNCKSIFMTDILDLIHRLQKENKELKSPKFASWKLKFFNLKEEFDKELAEHEEFAKKANAEIERLTKEEYEKHKGFSREEVDEISETAIKNSRKETAEKFAARVKMAFYYEFDELIPSIMADKIDEICKEIIGEV